MSVTKQAGFPVLDFAGANRLSITRAITVNAGANRILIVFTHHEDAGGAVSGITYNGVALTKIGSVAAATWSHVEAWGLINPAVGTFNVIATKVTGGLNNWGLSIYVEDGADQTTGWRAAATDFSNSAAAASATVAGWTAGDMLLDALSIDSVGHVPAVGANQTSEFATQNFGASTNENQGSSQTTTDGIMSWTWTTAAPYSHIAIAVIAAAAGGPVNVNRSVAIVAQAASVVNRVKGALRPTAMTAKGLSSATGSKGVTRTIASTAQGLTSVTGQRASLRSIAMTAQGTSSVTGRKGALRNLGIVAQGVTFTQRTKGVLFNLQGSGQGSAVFGHRLGSFRSVVEGGRGLTAVSFSSGTIHSFTGTLIVNAQGLVTIAARKGATRPVLLTAQGTVSILHRKAIFRSHSTTAQASANLTGRLGSFRVVSLDTRGGVQIRGVPGHGGVFNITATGIVSFVGVPGVGAVVTVRVLDLTRPLYRCPAQQDDWMYPYVSSTLAPRRALSINPPLVVGGPGVYSLKCGGCGFEIDQALHGVDRR